jgi:26S proteasome regulatory subunit N1
MLRGLSSYYYKEPTLLFLVRLAQGLVHMGKGLLNLCPIHTDGQLVSGARPHPISYLSGLMVHVCAGLVHVCLLCSGRTWLLLGAPLGERQLCEADQLDVLQACSWRASLRCSIAAST